VKRGQETAFSDCGRIQSHQIPAWLCLSPNYSPAPIGRHGDHGM